MERSKHLFLIFFSLISFVAFGQTNRSIYQAYVSGDMSQWKKTIDSMYKTTKTNQGKLELVNYQYGYIAWCISNDKDSEAKKYMNKAEKLVEFLEKQNYNKSLLYAYKAAFVGFKIGLKPYKAPFIGSKSSSFAKKSVEFDSRNALAYVQLGNISYYKPKTMGGSKSKAMEHYLNALKIMEQKNQVKQNWNYLNLLVTIVNAYMDLEDYKKAQTYCLKIFDVEPEIQWVRDELYSKILKKI